MIWAGELRNSPAFLRPPRLGKLSNKRPGEKMKPRRLKIARPADSARRYKQIGNAVPVNMAWALGRALVRLLNQLGR